MKKNVGSLLALYPCPVAVVGTMNGEKPTWTLVAHMGIMGHDHVVVSLAKAHFINEFVKKNKKLSINLIDENMLAQADYAGSVSGANTDKSDLFEYEKGESDAPIINASPLTMECSVEDVYETNGFENFICTIDNTYVNEENLDENSKVDYNTLKPVLFEFPTYKYIKTGEIIGNCLSFKQNNKI